MAKWNVTVLVDASVNVEVEADTEEEAKDKALQKAPTPNICHQCSDELEVGEPFEAAYAYKED